MRYLKLLFLSIALATPAVHAASWQTVQAPKGLGTKWLAQVTNEQGHTLTIRRKVARAGYEAYAEILLGQDQQFDNTMPSYRIDNGPWEDTLITKIAGENLGLRWAYTETNLAGWRIWQSTNREIANNDALSPWMQGNTITVRYQDNTGKSQTIRFSLAGSAKAIHAAITGPLQ